MHPVTGEKIRKQIMLFPRYDQWEAVTKLVDAARTEGPGPAGAVSVGEWVGEGVERGRVFADTSELLDDVK